MIATDVQDGNGKLEENLQLLHSLARELDRAMHAISHNSLSELEDSIANQQLLSGRLAELADDVTAHLLTGATASVTPIDEDLMRQIHVASGTLQTLNQRYSALLQHSSRSVELMVSLFRSFSGQFQEGSGPRLKQQTWSCQI
jgi:hypothetical protein